MTNFDSSFPATICAAHLRSARWQSLQLNRVVIDLFAAGRRIASLKSFFILAVGSLLIAMTAPAFAIQYTTSPLLGTWSTLGLGIDARADSTNASNPITNSEILFTVRRKTGTFTSNGVMCLCLARVDGSCAPQFTKTYSIGATNVVMPVLTANFVDNRAYFLQRSNDLTTACTNLDPSFKSSNIVIVSQIAPPVVSTLTVVQSGLGVSGTV